MVLRLTTFAFFFISSNFCGKIGETVGFEPPVPPLPGTRCQGFLWVFSRPMVFDKPTGVLPSAAAQPGRPRHVFSSMSNRRKKRKRITRNEYTAVPHQNNISFCPPQPASTYVTQAWPPHQLGEYLTCCRSHLLPTAITVLTCGLAPSCDVPSPPACSRQR